MTSQLIGPLYTNVTYLGAGPFTDFYFICRVNYQELDGQAGTAGFEVALWYEARLSDVIKTTMSSSSSSSLDVIFTSEDVKDGFGTKVYFICRDGCCVVERTKFFLAKS